MDEIYLVYLNNILRAQNLKKKKLPGEKLVANCRGPDPNLTKNKQKILSLWNSKIKLV